MNRSISAWQRVVRVSAWVLAGLLVAVVGHPAPGTALPRQTFLGLRFDLADRSGPGLKVSEVLPRSTAAQAGVRAGDRLTSFGRIGSLRTFAELRAELAATAPGVRVPLRWYRGNTAHRVSPNMQVLPPEQVPGSWVRYDEVSVDGIRQRLIMTEPDGGAHVLVLYVADTACESQDFWLDDADPVKQLIDGWAAAGLATARLEKRGLGDSEGAACSLFDFEDERRGYVAAVRRIADIGFGGRILLFGHGAGGLLAPLLVNDEVIGVLVYGTAGVVAFDHLMQRGRRHDELLGLAAAAAQGRAGQRAEFLRALLYEGLTDADLQAGMPDAAVLESLGLDTAADGLERPIAYFEQLGALDPGRLWQTVWQPVLALHGEHDWLSSRAEHEQIARLSGGRFETVAGVDGRLQWYEEARQALVSAGTGPFDEAVVEATLTWIEAVLPVSRSR